MKALNKQNTLNTLSFIVKQREILLGLIIVIAAIFLQVSTGGRFLTAANLLAILDTRSIDAFVVIGVTYLLIAKEFDLSTASSMALSSIVCAWFMVNGFSIPMSIFAGLLVGAAIGCTNGILVTQLGMPSFIATMGTMFAARSLTQVIGQGSPVSGLPQAFIDIGDYRIFGVLWTLVLLVFVVVVLQVLIKRQNSMFKLFYIGTNEKAAQMVGIKTKKQRWIMFVVCSTIAAFAGLILTARARSAAPIAFQGMELRFIAASVIGGASINGGQGSILGALLGHLVIALIGNTMTQLSIAPSWEGVIFGSVLLVAAITDAVSKMKITA